MPSFSKTALPQVKQKENVAPKAATRLSAKGSSRIGEGAIVKNKTQQIILPKNASSSSTDRQGLRGAPMASLPATTTGTTEQPSKVEEPQTTSTSSFGGTAADPLNIQQNESNFSGSQASVKLVHTDDNHDIIDI